jgi:uncharacterized caspase-like protein
LGVAGLGEYGSTDPDKKGSDKDKESKDLAEIADRYHEITREVSALEHQLELLGKEKERAFGAKKIQAMDEEIEAMEELAQK